MMSDLQKQKIESILWNMVSFSDGVGRRYRRNQRTIQSAIISQKTEEIYVGNCWNLNFNISIETEKKGSVDKTKLNLGKFLEGGHKQKSINPSKEQITQALNGEKMDEGIIYGIATIVVASIAMLIYKKLKAGKETNNPEFNGFKPTSDWREFQKIAISIPQELQKFFQEDIEPWKWTIENIIESSQHNSELIHWLAQNNFFDVETYAPKNGDIFDKNTMNNQEADKFVGKLLVDAVVKNGIRKGDRVYIKSSVAIQTFDSVILQKIRENMQMSDDIFEIFEDDEDALKKWIITDGATHYYDLIESLVEEEVNVQDWINQFVLLWNQQADIKVQQHFPMIGEKYNSEIMETVEEMVGTSFVKEVISPGVWAEGGAPIIPAVVTVERK